MSKWFTGCKPDGKEENHKMDKNQKGSYRGLGTYHKRKF